MIIIMFVVIGGFAFEWDLNMSQVINDLHDTFGILFPAFDI